MQKKSVKWFTCDKKAFSRRKVLFWCTILQYLSSLLLCLYFFSSHQVTRVCSGSSLPIWVELNNFCSFLPKLNKMCKNVNCITFVKPSTCTKICLYFFFFLQILCFASVPMTFLCVCELLGEMPRAGHCGSTSFHKFFLMSL